MPYEKPLVVDCDLLSCFAQIKRIDILTKLFSDIILLEIVKGEIKDAPDEIFAEVNKYIVSNKFLNDSVPIDSTIGHKFVDLIYSSGGIGDGEAAVMAYCTYKKAIVGSNNLRDVLEYCKNNRIELKTTTCIMYEGYEEKLFTKNEGNKMWIILKGKGNRLPNFKTFTEVIKRYVPLTRKYLYNH